MNTTPHPQAVDAGTLSFDAESPIAKATAEAASKAGTDLRSAISPVRRARPIRSDSGGGWGYTRRRSWLVAAQHVENGKWTPSEALGMAYGKTAAAHAKSGGLPAGTSIWLELEEVVIGTPVNDLVACCNAGSTKLRRR